MYFCIRGSFVRIIFNFVMTKWPSFSVENCSVACYALCWSIYCLLKCVSCVWSFFMDVFLLSLDKQIYHNTVGTPYNTVPYSTGSNIAWLGHGSQNLWNKLWIPVMKEPVNRFPCMLLSCENVSPKREFTIAPTSQLWLPAVLPSKLSSSLYWYDTKGIVFVCHQSTA